MKKFAKRICVVFATSLAIGGSLLAFPETVPWMVAAWFLFHTAIVLRGGVGWFPLILVALMVIVKRPAWSAAPLALIVIIMGIGCLRAFSSKANQTLSPRCIGWVGLVVLWVAWFVYLLDFRAAASNRSVITLHPTRPIVCLGDSLTQFGYPDRLNGTLSVPVINLGVQGITSKGAIGLLPDLVRANPQMVVVELGGNDFVQGDSQRHIEGNLREIIRTCRKIGAEVTLVEIPRGFVSDPFGGLERRLAREFDLQLVPDTTIRRLILFSPQSPLGVWFDKSWHLSNDGLHPNTKGNGVLAAKVADALARVYGKDIFAKKTINQTGDDVQTK